MCVPISIAATLYNFIVINEIEMGKTETYVCVWDSYESTTSKAKLTKPKRNKERWQDKFANTLDWLCARPVAGTISSEWLLSCPEQNTEICSIKTTTTTTRFLQLWPHGR